ncbi:hypothetical protein [Methylobacterium sp. 092160098-2]|uniref:hypothetical protein n=1 Tax=Methylobacterium sp. 092160098-2 TaxID=3025129 RepID=UPI002381991E|nr:hypothetical protein [Methylobacterium sp. 092160098-2]MDE4914944.1 hypothetical protein [Methylobacterium sp. 092160098-2]
MLRPSAVAKLLLALAPTLLSLPAASAEDVSGIEVSVRARSLEEGRALAVRAAADEAARRLGLDPATTVVDGSTFRDERFQDGRLDAVVDLAVEGRPSGTREGRQAADRRIGSPGIPWILVVHAVRDRTGRLVPWDRSDPWGAIWRVPTVLDRFKLVPVTGDAEDAGMVTGPALDAFEGKAFRHLVAKYRAPAVAVVVREGGEAALAVWRNGSATEWSRLPIADLGDPAATRIAMSKALADLVRSAPSSPSYADRDAGPPDRSGDSIRISDWRMGPAGGAEYRALLAADDRDDVVGRLSAEGIEVLSMRDGPSGTEVVLSSPEGMSIEAGLRRAGVRMSR